MRMPLIVLKVIGQTQSQAIMKTLADSPIPRKKIMICARITGFACANSSMSGSLACWILGNQPPSNSPSGYQFAKYDAILREYQRNSNDDFLGAIDWKPVQRTKVTFEEQIVHYKADSYFTLEIGRAHV